MCKLRSGLSEYLIQAVSSLAGIQVGVCLVSKSSHFLPLLCSFSVASLVAQAVKNLPAMWEPRFDPGVGKIPWRRKRQLTPVFLSEEFHGQRNLVGYSPCGHKESDTTERLTHWTSSIGIT